MCREKETNRCETEREREGDCVRLCVTTLTWVIEQALKITQRDPFAVFHTTPSRSPFVASQMRRWRWRGHRSPSRRCAVITLAAKTKSRSLTFSHVTHATLERLRRVPVRTDAAVPVVLLDYFRLALLSSHGWWFFVHNTTKKTLSKGDVKCSWPNFCNCCCCCYCWLCSAAAVVVALLLLGEALGCSQTVTAASFLLLYMHTFSFCTPLMYNWHAIIAFFPWKTSAKSWGQIENCCGVAVCDARINTKCCWTAVRLYRYIAEVPAAEYR